MSLSAVRLATGILTFTVLFAGCGSSSDTFTVRPGSNWTPVANKTKVEIVTRRQVSLDETVHPASPVALQKSLSMSGMLAARQWLVDLGAAYGLSPRPATRDELNSGFTEAISREGGPAILVAENDTSTELTVRVVGPANSDTRAITSAVRQQFAPMTSRPESAEDFRKQYNLPGRAPKR